MMKNYDVKEKFNRLLELLADHSVTMLDGYDYVSMETIAHEINCIVNSLPNDEDNNTTEKILVNKCNDCKYGCMHWYDAPCNECNGYTEFVEREEQKHD